MRQRFDRREFLKMAGVGGVVFASGLRGAQGATPAGGKYDDFYFVQLSDSHWGFQGPPNPDAKGTLQKAVAAVNSLSEPPDFIVFTGDLTHTTDDAAERRKRLAEFKQVVAALKNPNVRFQCIGLLDHFGDDPIIEPVSRMLYDSVPRVRKQALPSRCTRGR